MTDETDPVIPCRQFEHPAPHQLLLTWDRPGPLSQIVWQSAEMATLWERLGFSRVLFSIQGAEDLNPPRTQTLITWADPEAPTTAQRQAQEIGVLTTELDRKYVELAELAAERDALVQQVRALEAEAVEHEESHV